jgi:hypothetical protein
MVSVKLTMKITIPDVGLSFPTYHENQLSRSILSLNELSMAIIITVLYSAYKRMNEIITRNVFQFPGLM